MREYISIIKYYLSGTKVRYALATLTLILIAYFSFPSVTVEKPKEPTLQELQAKIKTQIDNANSGIDSQKAYASEQIRKAQAIIQRMTACSDANQKHKEQNLSLTLESFSKGVQPLQAIDCKAYKVNAYTGTSLKADVNGVSGTVEHRGPLTPSELMLTTKASDKCNISQSPGEHFISNKRFAFDVACGFGTSQAQQFVAYAPDYRNLPVVYTVTAKYNDRYTGNTIELSFKDSSGTPMKWVIGHLQTRLNVNDTVKTGQTIGQSDLSGETTGHHNHIEIWMNGVNFDYTTRSQVIDNERHGKLQSWKWGDKIHFTRYTLGDPRQNDATPCIGASNIDICHLAKSGIKVVALTSDVRKSLGIRLKESILIDGPCGGVYQVHDDKAKKYRLSCITSQGYCNKGDIATEVGHRDKNNKLVIDYVSVPNCQGGGVHTLVKKVTS